MPISPGMLFLQIVCVKGISGLVRLDIIFYRQKIHENQAIEIGNSLNHVVSSLQCKKWSLFMTISPVMLYKLCAKGILRLDRMVLKLDL